MDLSVLQFGWWGKSSGWTSGALAERPFRFGSSGTSNCRGGGLRASLSSAPIGASRSQLGAECKPLVPRSSAAGTKGTLNGR